MASSDLLKCSKCGKEIKSRGTLGQIIKSDGGVVIGGDNFANMLFDGNVCRQCKAIYCLSCSSVGSKCYKCGNPVEILFGDRIPR